MQKYYLKLFTVGDQFPVCNANYSSMTVKAEGQLSKGTSNGLARHKLRFHCHSELVQVKPQEVELGSARS